MNRARYTLNEPAVASQLIDGETILIHFDQGRYYSAAGLGSELLQLLLEHQSPERLVELLTGQFSIERTAAAESVARYVDILLRESLIVPDARSTQAHNGSDFRFATSVFEQPVLEMHSELEDLLRLDPLHDVDDTGWPSVAAEPKAPS